MANAELTDAGKIYIYTEIYFLHAVYREFQRYVTITMRLIAKVI